ncbi:MAG: hypothetical protein QGH33_08095 [Pirellulaceae bacterium]|jgi:hypothetical protein|nr:hypothetical protein [Pirellulaceae bacterium]
MDSHDNQSGPELQNGYMPYFYASGRFLQDALQHEAGTSYVVPARQPYEFASHQGTLAIEHQTVEQIIARGYLAVPHHDPETAILGDKQDSARLGLDDVITQIRGRHEIYERTVEELHESMCEANNGVHRQVAAQGHRPCYCPAVV